MKMQLKHYQRSALERVDDFLRLAKLRAIPSAYSEVARRPLEASEFGDIAENPYALRQYETLVKGLEDCPHVCVRIPTGGGKTLLAAHSIPSAGRFAERDFPTALWLVPSEAIRNQTAALLRDRRHPCRAFLDEAYSFQTEVIDITDFDALSAGSFFGKACVIVSTIQAMRIRETARKVGEVERARRRVYASHEALDAHYERLEAEHPAALEHPGLERDSSGNVKRSFANLLHVVRPAVIVDEAHNAVSPLSQETLRRVRPSCILEFTATPRDESESRELLDKKKHNILVSVPARVLREAEMIKLPVQLTEHRTWRDAVGAAMAEQRRLEEISRESGDSVRPIVLYQAETNIQGQNRVTWEKLEAHLLEELGEDGEKQVAVETGPRRDLSGVDLLSPDCEVRHVVTVQALREGWDCPFAYVLCSAAESVGDVAIEQIMGRVLRMPFARERKARELNLAYAHVRASDYAKAADALCSGMAGRMGFDEEELRENIQRGLPGLRGDDGEDEGGGIFGVTVTTVDKPDFAGLDAAALEVVREAVEVKPQADGKYAVSVREGISKDAREAIARVMEPRARPAEKERLERFVRKMERHPAPSRRGVKFALLPQLKFKSPADGEVRTAGREEFYNEANWDALGKECILGADEFRAEESGKSFTIYLSESDKMRYRGEGEYELPFFHEGASDESRLSRWLEGEVRDPQGRYVPSTLREFVRMNVAALRGRDFSLARLARAKYQLAEALRRKLDEHGKRMLEESAGRILFSKDSPPWAAFDFAFATRGYQYNRAYSGSFEFRKHYYPVVGDLLSKGEEYRCAVALDSLDEVRHWVRNVDSKPTSYVIPRKSGRNFYPDFVAELTDGKTLVVEYKGADRRKEAAEKERAGQMIEEKSGGRTFFIMPSEESSRPSVFEQLRKKIDGIMKAA